jgi:hypothetical protein
MTTPFTLQRVSANASTIRYHVKQGSDTVGSINPTVGRSQSAG